MPATLLALQVFLILLPGFSAAYAVHALATRRSQSDFERVIEALVFSFIIYVCYIPLNGGKLPFHIQDDPASKGNSTVLWEPAQLARLVAVTEPLPFLPLCTFGLTEIVCFARWA